jgi:hypothetical protein
MLPFWEQRTNWRFMRKLGLESHQLLPNSDLAPEAGSNPTIRRKTAKKTLFCGLSHIPQATRQPYS